MTKKFLIFILVYLCLISSSYAEKILVGLIYPFAASSSQSNYLRELANEANQQQSKYFFFVNVKTGGSGVVAVNHVLTQSGINLLSTSAGSFFTRVELYPEASWNPDEFQPLLIECNDMPYIIVSKKYKSLSELKNQKRLTIGMISGHLTELIAIEFKKQLPNTELSFIYYPSTSAGTKDVLGDILDLNVDVPASATPWINDKKLFAIGATGNKKYKGFTSFEDQGIAGFKYLTASWFLLNKKTLDAEASKEIKQILVKANQSEGIKKLYAIDYCSPGDNNLVESSFNFAGSYWPKTAKKLFKSKVDN